MAWAWAAERDELRREVRKDEGGTFTVWPKVDGKNVAVSDTGSHCTVGLYKPDGTVLRAVAEHAHTAVGDFDKFVITVTATEAATLDEGYTARISWRENGGSIDYLDIVQWDVVAWPWWQRISLTDIMGLFPGAGEILDRLGVELGLTTGDVAKECMAAEVGYDARVELDTLVRSKIANDLSGPLHTYTGIVYGGTPSRPALILNREALARYERPAAVAIMFEKNGGTLDGSDQTSQLMRTWRAKADAAWAAVPPFEYDLDGDLVVDDIEQNPGKSIVTRRVQ